MASRFVSPQVKTLPLSDGDSITVRRRLNHGEQQAAYGRMYVAGVDGRLRVNPLQSGRAMVTAYLVDWTLKDESGALVPLRDPQTGAPLSPEDIGAVLDNLEPDTYREIRQAIEAHEASEDAAREQEKKVPVGETAS